MWTLQKVLETRYNLPAPKTGPESLHFVNQNIFMFFVFSLLISLNLLP